MTEFEGARKTADCEDEALSERSSSSTESEGRETSPKEADLVPSPQAQPIEPSAFNAPDRLTVVKQLIETVSLDGCPDDLQAQLRDDAIALYAALEPRDAIESAIGRLLVGATNLSMAAMGRAADPNRSAEARAIESRSATKGAQVLVELVKAIDQHRGRSQHSVQVGQVKVEAGGKAIVGNVRARESQEPVESRQRASDDCED